MDLYNLSTETITAVGVSLLVIFCLVGLIIWNSRAKVQAKTLKSIDDKINESEKQATDAEVLVKISAEASVKEKIKEEEILPVESVEGKETLDAEGTAIDESVALEGEIAFAPEKTEEAPAEVLEIMENNYNVGKSGKVYSKSELQELIRN